MQKTTRKVKKDTTKNNETDIIEDTVTKTTTPRTTKTTTPRTPKAATQAKTTTPRTPKATTETKTTPTPTLKAIQEKSVEEPTKKSTTEDISILPVYQANIITNIDEIIANIETEIDNIREGISTKSGIKFLRSVNKNVKVLRTKTFRVMKQKPPKLKNVSNRNNTNSGFLKPVSISKEMSTFAGWKPDELHSRVDVTKYICNYIKENNLQNPDDKRQITPDAKLKKLLNYTTKGGEPLKYYSLQTCLKQHFPKTTS